MGRLLINHDSLIVLNGILLIFCRGVLSGSRHKAEDSGIFKATVNRAMLQLLQHCFSSPTALPDLFHLLLVAGQVGLASG